MSDLQSSLPAFTAHNIKLLDGRETLPGRGLIEESGVSQATLRTLKSLFRPADVPSTSIVDLGCLEGGYTVGFARAGFRATGIEVRDRNMECCRFVEQEVKLDNLNFIQDDARNLDKYGSFDAVFCCGLLYHLDQPTAYLKTLAECTRRVLILQTHFAEDTLPKPHQERLSAMSIHEGNLGRWYREFDEGVSVEEVAESAWSAWGNNDSFWIEKKHLLRSLANAGFDCIYEQYDLVSDIVTDTFWEEQGRGMFIAVKLDRG
jgi:SAM-dependent methyltransferase